MNKPKPTTVYFKNSQMPFKKFCQFWRAEYAILDGKWYKLPQEWNKKKVKK